MSGEHPDLQLGDSGEDVLELQVRLFRLRYYRQVPDSTYDSVTESAVRELQSALGADNTGVVDAATWQALDEAELREGLQYRYYSPWDALDQIRYDLENPADASGDFRTGDPALSEDGQWRWDGNDWQPAGATGGQWPADHTQYEGQLSEDGQWRWDGRAWQAAADAAAGATGSWQGTLSEDGYWRWDGAQWQPA